MRRISYGNVKRELQAKARYDMKNYAELIGQPSAEFFTQKQDSTIILYIY